MQLSQVHGMGVPLSNLKDDTAALQLGIARRKHICVQISCQPRSQFFRAPVPDCIVSRSIRTWKCSPVSPQCTSDHELEVHGHSHHSSALLKIEQSDDEACDDCKERHKYVMVVAYDGTDYAGWQWQPSTPRTIQGEVEQALGVLTRQTRDQLTVAAAGRTDAGVHAWGQVVQFRTASPLPSLSRTHASLNALLPPAIRIRSLHPSPSASFHPQRSAAGKRYRYSICNSPVRGRDPIESRGRLSFSRCLLDRAAMAEAAQLFVGVHDFSAFANTSEAKSQGAVRHVTRFVLVEQRAAQNHREAGAEQGFFSSSFGRGCASHFHDGGLAEAVEPCFHFEVEGDGFLYKQVRNMVGLLLAVGQGKLRPSVVRELIEARDRSLVARVASCAKPEGLCLREVFYPKELLRSPVGDSHGSVDFFYSQSD